MVNPVSNQPVNTGRSPDADLIYQQFLNYYNDINTKINAIDQLSASQQALPNVVQDRAQLLAIQKQIYSNYTSQYGNSNDTISSFESLCAPLETEVAKAYADATGSTASTPPPVTTPPVTTPPVTTPPVTTPPVTIPPVTIPPVTTPGRSPDASQIYSQYLTDYGAVNTQIGALDALPYNQRIQSQVVSDRTQLVALQQNLYAVYQSQYNNSSATIASFNTAVAPIQAQALQVYDNAINATPPSTPPVTTPPVTTPPVTTPPVTTPPVTTPPVTTPPVTPVTPVTSPNPSPQTIQNGTWYVNWTSWTYPIPQGVNNVDIFVGNISPDANGNPSVNGLGTMSQNYPLMEQFIQGCQAKGITVNLSIGGSGGSYDNCWDNLTSSNVQGYAQALANFCNTYGLNGVDFDCEEFTSATDNPTQQALVGTLIKDFKNINPNFQTSLDTNAGFGPNYPWQGIVQNILNASIYTNPTTGKPTSGIDRVNIMAYFNSLSDEQGWVTGWANWLKANYNFSPAQITVGMDPAAQTYDPQAFAAWAAQQGYSTSYWDFDPGNATQSNQVATEIQTAYNTAKAA